jgi:hypothetical protein
MRKLRMAAVLPLVHFVVSIGVVGWPLLPLTEPSRKITLWFALNGPVLLLIDLAKRIFTMPWVSPYIPPMMEGERAIYFMFLFAGLALWFFVGRTLDNLRWRKAPNSTGIHLRGVLGAVTLITCGVRLIFHAGEWILPRYSGQHHSMSDMINGAIISVWAILFILLPCFELANRTRQRRPIENLGTDG